MRQLLTLQNPLLDEVVGLRAGLETVVNFILEAFSVCEHKPRAAITYLKLSAL
jgi:hypothetical protein